MASIHVLTILFSLSGILGANIGNASSLSLPLVDNMLASLTANIDISQMKTVIKDYIDQLVKKNVDASLNGSIASVMETMEKKFVTKTEFQTSQKGGRKKGDLPMDCSDNCIRKKGDLPTDCSDPIIKNKLKTAGIYTVSPDGKTTFDVRCEPGGWTVIQRRFDGSTEFYRDWQTYEIGFGDLNQEFRLGNKYIALLTSNGKQELRVNLSYIVASKYARYSTFKVGDSSTKYTLYIGGYSGNAVLGDGMEYHNRQPFSTYDQDNDKSSLNCAAHVTLRGAWWYKGCWKSSLNGEYVTAGRKNAGIRWSPWKGNGNVDNGDL